MHASAQPLPSPRVDGPAGHAAAGMLTHAEILAAAPVIVYVYDLAEGASAYQNRPLGELLGYDGDAAAALGPGEWRSLMHPDDQRRFPDHRARLRALGVGESATWEYRMRHADGSWRWILSRDVRVLGGTGGTGLVVGSASDVTTLHLADVALRQSEAALRDGQARYRSLLESMDQGFCIMEMVVDDAGRTVDYRFLEVNSRFEQHTGLHDAVGRRARELVPGLEQHWVDIYDEVARTGVPRSFQQASDAMGRQFDVEAVRVGAPAELRVALLFRDVTDRRRAEAELHERERRLEAALRVKDEFLGLVSHELRTPMTVILGMSRLLAGGRLDAAQATDVAGDIAESAEVLNELVAAMLLLARLDEGEAAQLREPVLLHRLAAEVTDTLAARNPGIRFQLVTDDRALIVAVQRTWLERVVENLAGNAVKYGARTVSVVVDRDAEDLARLRVLDDGPGLGDDADRLFEPFYRSPGARDRAAGVGLGLAVADRVITLSGGRIWGRSRPEGGAEFGFVLPLAREGD